MSEIKETINAVVNILNNTLPIKVYRNRSRPVDTVPSVAVRMGGDDETGQGGLSYSLRRLVIYIDLYVMSDDDEDLDSKLLDLRAQVEAALPQNSPIPNSPIQYFESLSQQDPNFNSEGEESAASMRLIYPAIYLTRN